MWPEPLTEVSMVIDHGDAEAEARGPKPDLPLEKREAREPCTEAGGCGNLGLIVPVIGRSRRYDRTAAASRRTPSYKRLLTAK